MSDISLQINSYVPDAIDCDSGTVGKIEKRLQEAKIHYATAPAPSRCKILALLIDGAVYKGAEAINAKIDELIKQKNAK